MASPIQQLLLDPLQQQARQAASDYLPSKETLVLGGAAGLIGVTVAVTVTAYITYRIIKALGG